MWIKYLTIPIYDDSIEIGIKYNPDRDVCIIGGQKRFINVMQQIAEYYFGAEDIKTIIPQSYKVRLSFKCRFTEKEIQDLVRKQTEYYFGEVSSLGRRMR